MKKILGNVVEVLSAVGVWY